MGPVYKGFGCELCEIKSVSGSISAYVCQCVTEHECVSGKPRVSVSPSVSETHWNAGEERAWESQDA